jgi:MraZ protein
LPGSEGIASWSTDVEFWDYNEHNIDGKGRLVLPSSFRSAFTDGGVLTYQGTYVAIMTPAEWEKRLREMTASGVYSAKELNFVKSMVTVFQPDAQNRVTIPARLRDRVGLDREVAMIGMGRHIAVYPRQVWLALEDDLAGDLSTRLSEAF